MKQKRDEMSFAPPLTVEMRIIIRKRIAYVPPPLTLSSVTLIGAVSFGVVFDRAN